MKQEDQDDIFSVAHRDSNAIFWKENIKQVTPEKFMLVFKRAMSESSTDSFPGFSLLIFDIQLGTAWGMFTI